MTKCRVVVVTLTMMTIFPVETIYGWGSFTHQYINIVLLRRSGQHAFLRGGVAPDISPRSLWAYWHQDGAYGNMDVATKSGDTVKIMKTILAKIDDTVSLHDFVKGYGAHLAEDINAHDPASGFAENHARPFVFYLIEFVEIATLYIDAVKTFTGVSLTHVLNEFGADYCVWYVSTEAQREELFPSFTLSKNEKGLMQMALKAYRKARILSSDSIPSLVEIGGYIDTLNSIRDLEMTLMFLIEGTYWEASIVTTYSDIFPMLDVAAQTAEEFLGNYERLPDGVIP